MGTGKTISLLKYIVNKDIIKGKIIIVIDQCKLDYDQNLKIIEIIRTNK